MEKGPATLAGLVLALLCLSAALPSIKSYVNLGSLGLDFTCDAGQDAATCGSTVLALASPLLFAVTGVVLCLLLARRRRGGLCLAAGAGSLAAAWSVALCLVLLDR